MGPRSVRALISVPAARIWSRESAVVPREPSFERLQCSLRVLRTSTRAVFRGQDLDNEAVRIDSVDMEIVGTMSLDPARYGGPLEALLERQDVFSFRDGEADVPDVLRQAIVGAGDAIEREEVDGRAI